MKRNAVLVLILAVVAFFWIWFHEYLGAKAYWVTLVTFGVCLAYGETLHSSLPWMAIGGVVGPLLGLLTFALYMMVFPLYYGLSVAIAGAILILLMGAVSISRLREMLPMFLVGWGCFLGAVGRFEYLLLEKPIEAMPRALSTLVGVLASVFVGLLLAALLDALVLYPRRAKAARAASMAPLTTDQ